MIAWLISLTFGTLLILWMVAVAWMWGRQQKLLYPNPGIKAGNEDHQAIEDSPEGMRVWIDNPGCLQAILYFGGSGEAVELRRERMANAFPGYTRYLLPHRGAGPNGTLRGNERNLKQDAEILLGMARARHDSVHVIGRSLGTSLALHLAVCRSLDGLALITPFGSMADVAARRYRWLPVRTMLRDKHEAWRDAQRLDRPVLACLARHDRVTVRAHWERLARYLVVPTQVHMAECDHETILDDPTTWATIRSWFENTGRTDQDR